jgi:hypothetical protein
LHCSHSYNTLSVSLPFLTKLPDFDRHPHSSNFLRDTAPPITNMAAVHGPLAPSHPSPFRNAQSVPHSRMGYHPSVSPFLALALRSFLNFLFHRRHHLSHNPPNPLPPGIQILSTATSRCLACAPASSLIYLLAPSTPLHLRTRK